MPLMTNRTQKWNKRWQNLRKAVSSVRLEKNVKSQELCRELQQSLDNMREENRELRKAMKKKQVYASKVKQQLLTLQEEFEAKITLFEGDRQFLCDEINSLKNEINEKRLKLKNMEKENVNLKKQLEIKDLFLKGEKMTQEEIFKKNRSRLEEEISELEIDLDLTHGKVVKKILEGNDKMELTPDIKDNNILVKEVESLKTVLELKQEEIKNLQVALAEAREKEPALKTWKERLRMIQFKCEDIQEQLQKKRESERSLMNENSELRQKLKKYSKSEHSELKLAMCWK